MTILSTPKLGASFVDYVGTLFNEGGNLAGFGGGKIECIIYVIEGELIAYSDKDEHKLTQGGYLYCPAGVTMRFKIITRVTLHKYFYTNAFMNQQRAIKHTWFVVTSMSFLKLIMKECTTFIYKTYYLKTLVLI